MPTASGLGFVDREYHVRTVVRTTLPTNYDTSTEYTPTHVERVACGALISTVVVSALATLVWFMTTFERSSATA